LGLATCEPGLESVGCDSTDFASGGAGVAGVRVALGVEFFCGFGKDCFLSLWDDDFAVTCAWGSLQPANATSMPRLRAKYAL
jgi:hypothetical protein